MAHYLSRLYFSQKFDDGNDKNNFFPPWAVGGYCQQNAQTVSSHGRMKITGRRRARGEWHVPAISISAMDDGSASSMSRHYAYSLSQVPSAVLSEVHLNCARMWEVGKKTHCDGLQDETCAAPKYGLCQTDLDSKAMIDINILIC